MTKNRSLIKNSRAVVVYRGLRPLDFRQSNGFWWNRHRDPWICNRCV